MGYSRVRAWAELSASDPWILRLWFGRYGLRFTNFGPAFVKVIKRRTPLNYRKACITVTDHQKRKE